MAKTPAATANRKKHAKAKSGVSPVAETAAKSVSSSATGPRQLKTPTYKSFRLHKRIAASQPSLPSVFTLLRTAFGTLKRHWKLFAVLTIIYGLLNLLLVQGFSAVNLNDSKQTFDKLFSGQWGQLASGASLFAYLISSTGNTASATAGIYQVMLTIIVSLALIWLLRQLYAGHTVRVRDGFYRGMYPLVPFVLVLAVIGLQLIPATIGAMVYSAVVDGGLAATAIEQFLWATLLGLLVLVSLYMLCSSVFALYVVSLPDMTPLAALRSARSLVAQRRWTVIRKAIFLPVVLLLLAAVVIIPLILFATPVAPWAFFVVSMAILPVAHSYFYALYRALL